MTTRTASAGILKILVSGILMASMLVMLIVVASLGIPARALMGRPVRSPSAFMLGPHDDELHGRPP